MGVAGRLSGTVSPFRAEQGTSLETPLRARASSCCSGKEFAWQCRRGKRCRLNPWVRKTPWSRKWQPTPVFLPGESQGRRSLVGYSPWGLKELSEFSTVYFDPHSQRLWHSQYSRNRCFLKLSCFFYDPADVGNLVSVSSAFSKTSLNIRKFTVHS